MKTKFLKVEDEYTEMRFILIQVEEFDEEFFVKNGFKAGYKIVIQLRGGSVAAAGGYNFTPEYIGSSISDRSRKIDESGTMNTLGLLLNSVEDIKTLPSNIDINDLRESWLILKSKYITIKNTIDDLRDEGMDILNGEYKKILFKQNGYKRMTIGIVDKEFKSIFEKSYNDKSLLADYLWIPIPEVSDEEWINFTENNKLVNIMRIKV